MTDANPLPVVEPRLVVSDAAAAIAFYERALGATEIARFADKRLGKVVHAEIRIGSCTLQLLDEAPDWGNLAPTSLGNSPVLMHLSVASADDVAERMVAAGAEVVIPVEDRFYGAREGRLRDPYGHLWVVSQHLSDVADEDIQRGIEELFSR